MSPYVLEGNQEKPLPRMSQLLQFFNLVGPIQVLNAAEKRRHITFLPPDTSQVYFSVVNSATAGKAITIAPFTGPIDLDYYIHGAIVCAAWFAIPNAAGISFAILEVMAG